VYVFRDKNSSEELLSRIDDERSEGDLNMGRLKYLIGKLEELYAEMGDSQLEMDDIEMSAALIKETLKKVYDGKSNQVLEAILETPKKAIPVILSRLHKVYKDNLATHRQRRKFWRSLVDEHYYKAYDTKGVMFKSEERNLLSLKQLHSGSPEPLAVRLDDREVVALIRELFAGFVQNASSAAHRRLPADEQVACFDSVFGELLRDDYSATVDFDYYALSLYICTLFSRFSEIKNASFDPITPNRIAVEVGLQKNVRITDRFAELVDAARGLVAKDIDADAFEEKVRQLTDSRGYKLYNLRKILSKIEKQVMLLLDRRSEGYNGESSYPGTYAIECKAGTITLCQIRDGFDESAEGCAKE